MNPLPNNTTPPPATPGPSNPPTLDPNTNARNKRFGVFGGDLDIGGVDADPDGGSWPAWGGTPRKGKKKARKDPR